MSRTGHGANSRTPVSYRHGDLVCTDHTLDVPLDHRNPGGPSIGLFAREVTAAGREHEDLPRLLWLQGGPGGREMVYPWPFEEDPVLVPLRVAAVCHDDMYVDRGHSLATAEAVRGLRTWVTDAYAHDGVRADAAVLDRLIAMGRHEV